VDKKNGILNKILCW